MTKEREEKLEKLSEKVKCLNDAAVDKAAVFVDGMIALAAAYKSAEATTERKAEKQE